MRCLQVSVTGGPEQGLTVTADDDGPLAIGTAKDNDVVLSDRTVSRYHLELTPMPMGIRVIDLGSRNGTSMNGLRVERAHVPVGTTIEIGESTLVVRDAAGQAVTEPSEAPIPGFIARSPAMQKVTRDLRKLAGSDASVLVQGETGTGKEVVAHAIHSLSRRAAEPFVVVDCGSLPAALIASELFGHERGAFTGADRLRKGAFERAHGGTVFLDEIGELPLEVQPALLGVLERRRFRRVGGDSAIEVDVRVLSATHRELRSQVNEERFRADLYYRLAVARLTIPPLRERPEDIPPLVSLFAEEIGGGGETPFGEDAMAALTAHRWSGNVRELRNVVEAALAMGRLRIEDTVRGSDQTAPRAEAEPLATYKDARAAVLDEFEKSYLSDLMRRCDDNASEAARRARMARPYLLRLLRRHGLR